MSVATLFHTVFAALILHTHDSQSSFTRQFFCHSHFISHTHPQSIHVSFTSRIPFLHNEVHIFCSSLQDWPTVHGVDPTRQVPLLHTSIQLQYEPSLQSAFDVHHGEPQLRSQ